MREVAGHAKLFGRMAACIPGPREPSLIGHDRQTMPAQRELGIARGWEDLNDLHGLRVDPLMQVAGEREADEARPWPLRRRCAGWRTASTARRAPG